MSRLPLIAACCAFLLSCGGPRGNIVGHVKVAAGHPDMGVFVVLWQIPATTQDPDDPDSPLVPAVKRSQLMQKATMLGQIAVGVTDGEARDFKYNLYSLERGLYVVGAYLDTNQTPNRNMLTDVHVIDSDAPIEVNPGAPPTTTVSRDLYLGKSAPDKGTISGVIHMSDRTASSPVVLIGFDGNPFSDSSASVVLQSQLEGSTEAPFTLFNIPLPADGTSRSLYLAALSDADGDGELSFYRDHVAVLLENPLYLQPDSSEVSGLELWMDRQAPARGSLAGTIDFSSRLQVGATTLLAFSSDPAKNSNANVVGVFNGTAVETASFPFWMPSLPRGSVWLIGLLQTPGAYSPSVSAQYSYGANDLGLTPVPIPLDGPQTQDFSFPMGVGRVSGAIVVGPESDDVGWAWVFVNRAGTTDLVLYDTITFTQGERVAPYELFGLADGAYDVYVQTDGGRVMRGSPRTVKISGGSREGSDFKL